MGLYDDLIPKGASGTATATPTPKAGGIYADLIPPPAAPTPPDNRGFLAKMVDNVTGKGAPTVPTPPPPAAPAISSSSIYKDLIPAPTPPASIPPSLGSKIAAGVGKVSDTLDSITEPPAPGTIGTAKYLPSEIFQHLPFGIGEIFKQIQEDPETAAKLTFGDLKDSAPGALLDYGKEAVKGLIAGGLDLAGVAGEAATGGKYSGQISFNIPGLGQISNNQFNAATRVANGEDPVQVALEEGSAGIFNSLFFLDIAARPFTGRPVKTAEINRNANAARPSSTIDAGTTVLPKGSKTPGPIDFGAKSFRLYEQPTVSTPLPPEAIDMLQKQGTNLGKNFNPDLPTYFRVTGGKGGSLTGEVIQVKPSWYRTIADSIAKAKGSVSHDDVVAAVTDELKSKPEESAKVQVLHAQTIDIKAAEAAAKNPIIRLSEGAAIPAAQPTASQTVTPTAPQNFGNYSDLVSTNEQKMEQPNTATTKTPENGSAVVRPKTPEEAASRYWDEKVEPAIGKGEPVVLGADDLKDHFVDSKGQGDYADERHPVYSKATFQMYERALKDPRITSKNVIFLGGGPGSGKTELIVKHLRAQGFRGIIYDSNFANGEGADRQIDMARAAGKHVEIFGILPSIEKAAGHVADRAIETGRDVTAKSFAHGHVEFPNVVAGRIESGKMAPEHVHLLDLREGQNLMDAKAMVARGQFAKNPLAVLKNLGYSKEHVTATYEKRRRDAADHRQLQEQGLREASGKSPDKNRSDTTGHGGGDRSGTRQGVDKGRGATSKDSKSQIKSTENASIGAFRDGTPLTIDTNKIKAIDLPEMVQLAKMLMGQVPKIREKVSRHFGGTAAGVFIGKGGGEIRLRADLFDPKKNDIGQAAKTLAHEIGHLIDYLPEGTLSRGNILGRLLTLKNFGKEFTELAGASRSADEIKEELWQLSKYWKPVDEETAPKSFLEYRRSGKEVYADFISVLFNDPQLAMDRAPAAYNLFFENLDKKPLARDAYFEVQAMLSGEHADLVKARRQGVQQMFKDGDYKAIELQNEKMAEREARNKNLVFKLKFELVDKNQALIDRVNTLEKRGVHINPDDNPIYTFEERNYLGGKIKAFVESHLQPVYEATQKADIPWNTFGETLFYQRIIDGDRSIQANPRGITPEAATELQQDLRNELSPTQIKVLDESVKKFRVPVRLLADESFEEGLITPEMHQSMLDNPAYVTFQVIDHLETAMSSKVFKSIGTFKDITNPADASILKMIATIKAIERNKVTRMAIDFLKEHFPEEIEDAKSVFNGRNGTRFIDSRQPNQELALMYRNGKAEGHYIDPYIKKSIDNESAGQSLAVVAGLKFFNSHVFRPLFIGFNPGFMTANFIRDFWRFYKVLPTMTLGRAMQRYIEAYPIARTRAFGPKYNGTQKWMQAAHDLNMLEKEQVFSVTFNDLMEGAAHDDTQIDRILRTSGIDSFQPKQQHAALKPFVAILDFVKRVGDLIETLPKAAGFHELKDGNGGKPLTKDQKSYIRKYIGSPDFLAGGHLKPATNEIFLFSNAITQGIRADYDIATNPKTRGAYWYKTVKLNLLPKLLMYAAGLGLFGAGIKKMMDDASEYDKTNYIVIPLGHDYSGSVFDKGVGDFRVISNGKTIYFRMPQDETGRLIGGIAWKMMSGPTNNQPWTTDLAQIASFGGGQFPNISPAITAVGATFEYLSGQNPYDAFRGRNILSDDVFAAGGMRANEAFLGWMFNELGGGIIMRFANEQAVPQEEGPAEKFFNAPIIGNIVGRFFRVTDFGTTEQLQGIQKKVAGQEAETRLENKDLINSYVRKYQADKNRGVNQRKYELALVKEKFGGTAPTSSEDVAKAKNLVSSFRLALVKGSSPAEIDALVSSTSNAQKAAVLAELKSKMEPDQYKTLLDKAVSEKVVSPEVAHKAK